MIEEFEKSELSIRLADKMDKMERTWEWSNYRNTYRLKKIFSLKVRDLLECVTNRFVMRISCKFLYYLVIAILAYIMTRDGEYDAEENKLSTKQADMETPTFYKFVQAMIVFGIFLLWIFNFLN